MHGRNAQVARIYRILNLLEGALHGLTVLEITERLNDRNHRVSKRTVYRDLEALCDAGFPVFVSEQNAGEQNRWVLERNLKIGQYLTLSNEELFALCVARDMFCSLKNTSIHESFECLFRKIEEKLGQVHREYLAALSQNIILNNNTISK